MESGIRDNAKSGLLLVLLASASLIGCDRPQEIKATPPAAPVLQQTGIGEGWPPTVRGATDVSVVGWKEIPGALTDALEADLRQVAVADARVKAALGERFAYIMAGHVEGPKESTGASTQALSVRLVYFSHANNAAIEVILKDKVVERVDRIEGEPPPEGQEEIRAAAALAARDDRLLGKLAGLVPQGLLTTVPEKTPGYGHRLIDITFEKEGAEAATYFAVVDLTDRRVLEAGPMATRGRSK
jgi:hypothetical protein